MKKLILFLFTITVWAQTPDPVINTAKCVIPFAITATAQSFPSVAGFDNRQMQCDRWNITYSNFGFTPISLLVESAPLGTNTTAGTYVSFAGTVVTGGVNPNTAITQGETNFTGFFPFLRVTGTVTGSGRIWGVLIGNPSSDIVGGGGGGSVTITQPIQVGFTNDGTVTPAVPISCNHQAFVNLSGSGNTQIIAASGSTLIRVCQIYFSTISNPEDIKLTYGTGANCVTGTTDLTALFKSVQSGLLPFGSTSNLVVPSAKALCFNQSVAQATGVEVIYAQY